MADATSTTMIGVSSLNEKIKSLLESTFVSVLVEGEVSSVTYHTSGHLYFSIKDDTSAIKCVMFRSSVSKQKFRLEVGQHIIVSGSISVYTPMGEYQFYATNIEPFGRGAVALAFEQLKDKLSKQGYFENKKQIPKIIKKIALITAKDSAALHDMLKIIDKRWRMLEVVIVDTLVQGELAPSQIAKALRYTDTLDCDTIVVGRGGGSSDDLQAFNSEIVADAIFACKTPVVSAVGHEIDVMISDFVSDLRAPTPSAAIEMIFPDFRDALFSLDEQAKQYTRIMSHKISLANEQVNQLTITLEHASPIRKIGNMQEQFKKLKDGMLSAIKYKLDILSRYTTEYNQNILQNMAIVLALKEKQISDFNDGYILSNPNNRCIDGNARVWIDGVPSSLKNIKKGSQFVIEDSTATLTVECIEIKLV